MDKPKIICEITTHDALLREDAISLEKAMTTCFQQERTVNRLRIGLEHAKRAILVANAADMKALGSNEAAREATIAEQCAEFVARLTEDENTLAAAKHDLAIATLRFDYAKRRMSALQSIAAVLASGE